MSQREGPATFVETRQSCLGCKWHDWRMFKSGLDPVYEGYCKHPDPMISVPHEFFGGRYIGRTDRTPSWCPVQPRG